MRETILNEWLPLALSFGMSEEQFWNSNPRLMKPYIKAHELKTEQQDTLNWFLGQYIMSAIGVVLSDKKHNVKYVEKPFTTQQKEKREIENMSDEDKKRHTMIFFESLKTLQDNFNRSKEGGE